MVQIAQKFVGFLESVFMELIGFTAASLKLPSLMVINIRVLRIKSFGLQPKKLRCKAYWLLAKNASSQDIFTARTPVSKEKVILKHVIESLGGSG